MKKIMFFVIFIISLMSTSLVCRAADGNVTYSGNAGEFIFSPGTEHSPTDLFDNFKNVMPGDTISQKITVKNNADGNVKAEISTKKLDASSTSGDMEIRRDGDIRSAVLGSTSGNITFTAASAENVDMKSTSGGLNITLSGNVTKLHLDSTSGTILADLASADKAEFDSTSGNMDVTLQSFKDLDLDATSGNITLKLPNAPGFTLDLDAKPGNFSNSLAMEKSGSKYTYGNGSARLRIETTSGDIRIEK